MTHEGRPHAVQTAPKETTNLRTDLNRSVARDDRTVAIVHNAFASVFATLAKCRRDLEAIEQRRANGGSS